MKQISYLNKTVFFSFFLFSFKDDPCDEEKLGRIKMRSEGTTALNFFRINFFILYCTTTEKKKNTCRFAMFMVLIT